MYQIEILHFGVVVRRVCVDGWREARRLVRDNWNENCYVRVWRGGRLLSYLDVEEMALGRAGAILRGEEVGCFWRGNGEVEEFLYCDSSEPVGWVECLHPLGGGAGGCESY